MFSEEIKKFEKNYLWIIEVLDREQKRDPFLFWFALSSIPQHIFNINEDKESLKKVKDIWTSKQQLISKTDFLLGDGIAIVVVLWKVLCEIVKSDKYEKILYQVFCETIEIHRMQNQLEEFCNEKISEIHNEIEFYRSLKNICTATNKTNEEPSSMKVNIETRQTLEEILNSSSYQSKYNNGLPWSGHTKSQHGRNYNDKERFY